MQTQGSFYAHLWALQNRQGLHAVPPQVVPPQAVPPQAVPPQAAAREVA